MVAQWLFNQDDPFINKRGCLAVDKPSSIGFSWCISRLPKPPGPKPGPGARSSKIPNYSSKEIVFPRWDSSQKIGKITGPRFCCTAASTTSCMLLKPEGTDSKIRPFSRTFFKTLSLRGYGSQLGTLKIGWLLKITKNLQFTPKQLWVPSVFVLLALISWSIAVSKFSSRRPGCSFRPASSTRKPSASLNRSTDPSGKATREKVDVEAEAAEACDTVMLTCLFASPWKQNEMNFKNYSCGESTSENLEFDLPPRAAGFFRSLPPRSESKVSLLQLWLGAKVLQPNPSRSFQEQTSQEPFSLAPRFTLTKKKKR